MKFTNKIEAIKALRAIPRGTVAMSSVGGKYELTVEGGGLGLKEAKDLVEAICEMGVQYHLSRDRNTVLREFLQAELDKLPAPPSVLDRLAPKSCNRCGVKLPYPDSPQPCSDCYDNLLGLPPRDDIHF